MVMSTAECTLEIKKYLKKLRTVLDTQVKFSFFGTKVIDKKRFDDIFCCIEASWPEDYKKYLNKIDPRRLKSPNFYEALILATKNKFMFSTSCYAVNYQKAIIAIDGLIKSIDQDMNFIYSDGSGLH